MEKKYYRTVMSAVSVAEYWRLCQFNLLLFPLAILMFKIFRMRGDVNMAQAYIDDILRVPNEDVPLVVKNGVSDILAECQREGLSVDYFYRIDIISSDTAMGVVVLSPDRRFSCQIILTKSVDTNVPLICFFTCYSNCADGKILITTGGKKQLDSPPVFDVDYCTGKSVPEILARHRTRIEARTDLVAWTPEGIVKDIVRVNNLTLEDSIAKGKATEMSIFEVTELKRKLGYYR